MKRLNLIVSNVFFIFLLGGCSTSSFRIKDEAEFRTELLVSPDRVLLQCEKVDDDPNNDRYGFMVHILDDENTVTTLLLNIRPDKENCERHISRITRILKDGKEIYIGNRINLTKQPRTKDELNFRYTFPGHGTFSCNGRSLDLVFIANENGQCYGPEYQDEESKGQDCPQFPFPIEKYRNL